MAPTPPGVRGIASGQRRLAQLQRALSQWDRLAGLAGAIQFDGAPVRCSNGAGQTRKAGHAELPEPAPLRDSLSHRPSPVASARRSRSLTFWAGRDWCDDAAVGLIKEGPWSHGGSWDDGLAHLLIAIRQIAARWHCMLTAPSRIPDALMPQVVAVYSEIGMIGDGARVTAAPELFGSCTNKVVR